MLVTILVISRIEKLEETDDSLEVLLERIDMFLKNYKPKTKNKIWINYKLIEMEINQALTEYAEV